MYLSLLFVLASWGTLLLAEAQTTPCHKYVLVSLRGTGEPQGPSVGFTSMINQTLTNFTGGIEYPLPYPASASNIELSTAEGGINLTHYIDGATKACPSQQYIILGYSQGAASTILGVARYNTSSPQFAAIRGIVVIGNPGHKPFQPANVDQHGSFRTQAYVGAFYNIGLRFPSFWYQSLKLFDVCHTGDSICAPAYANSSFAKHQLYGNDSNVQNMGAVFMRSVLQPALIGS